MVKLNVELNDDGKKIATFITSKYPELSVNNVYKALRKKDIKVNGKRINENIPISYGDKIEVYISDEILNGFSKNPEIQKIYEDDNVLVVNKPKNLEVEGKNSLTEILEKSYNFIKPCHRIDRNTIGLVLFAKNESALNEIIEMFKNFQIEKHYVACCYGISPAKSKTLHSYLFKDSKKKMVYISDTPKTGYMKIETSYKVIDENKDKKVSLLDVSLHTGRTHQIRAHLAHSSLPIIGDGKYGSYEINKKFGVSSQLLASYSITFHIQSQNGSALNGTKKLGYLDGVTIKLKKVPFTEYL